MQCLLGRARRCVPAAASFAVMMSARCYCLCSGEAASLAVSLSGHLTFLSVAERVSDRCVSPGLLLPA